MSPASAPGVVDRYLGLALTGNLEGAVAVAVRKLSEGTSAEAILDEVLVPAQRAVGDRWHRNEIGVADEHVASHTAYAALYALGNLMPAPPPTSRVVIGCAEGDWHALAPHILSLQLRARGFAATVLGCPPPPITSPVSSNPTAPTRSRCRAVCPSTTPAWPG